MFFRRRRKPDPRVEAWGSLAERLELTALDQAQTDWFRADLGIDSGRVSSLHVWRRIALPELFLFEYARPRQGRRGLEEPRVRIVLRAEEGLGDAAWRAFPKSHPLLESLQASRSGGEPVATGDEAFDERVGIVAREPEAGGADIGPDAREALTRLLTGDGMPDATVTSGNQHLSWRAHGAIEPPFDVLEAVTARLLMLWLASGGAEAAFGVDRS